MKAQHFCTEELVGELKNPTIKIITTFRTGWIPTFQKGEIVKLNERDDQGIDTLICHGKVIECRPIQYKDIPLKGKKEIKRYNRKFSDSNWFFKETFKKILNINKFYGGFDVEDLIIEEFFGDNLTPKRFIKNFTPFDKEKFMFSAADFYGSKYRKNRLEKLGIHKYVRHDGPLMLDSGGFQLLKKNCNFELDETIEIYRLANLKKKDFGIVLDNCPIPSETPEVRLQKIRDTNHNLSLMRERAPELNNKIIHVVHGWIPKELNISLSVAEGDPLISIGSCFPLVIKGFRKQIIQKFYNLLKIIDKNPIFKEDTRFHVLGANGANPSHICWFAGLEQTDSSAWRRIAAFGKIVFVGVSEVSISDRDVNFGNTNWTEIHDKKLRICECPICSGLSLQEKKTILKKSFKARAIHNAFVFLEERNIARELVGTPKYHNYLENRFKKNYLMKAFLKKIREAKFQPNLDRFLKPNLSNTIKGDKK